MPTVQTAGEINVQLSLDVQEFMSGLREATRGLSSTADRLKKSGKNIAKVGAGLTAGITAPLAAIGITAFQSAREFEQQMANVQAVTGATGDTFESLKMAAEEIGATTKFTATEAGQALEYMGLAGWSAEQSIAALPGVINLAAASGEDLALVSDIVTDSMSAFKMEAKDAGKFADVLAATSANANTNVAMLGESFKYSAAVAGAMGYTAEDTALALGLMANTGIKASMAGTALRSVMTRMAKPTAESQGAMTDLGLSLEDDTGRMKTFREVMDDMREGFAKVTPSQKAMYAAMLGGKPAMAGLLALVDQSQETYDELAAAIDGSAGAAEKMADIKLDTFEGQLTLLKSALDAVGREAIKPILDIAKTVIKEAILPLVDAFSSLSPSTKKVITIFAALAAAVGPILIAVGGAIALVGTAAGGIATAAAAAAPLIAAVGTSLAGALVPLGIAVGVIAAVVASLVAFGATLVHAYQTNEEFREKVNAGFAQIRDAVGQAMNVVMTLVRKTWAEIQRVWDEHGERIMGITMRAFDTVVTTIRANISTAKTVIETTLNVIIGLWRSHGDILITWVVDMFNTIRLTIGGALQIISGLFSLWAGIISGDWSAMWEGIKLIAGGAVDFIIGLVGGLLSTISGAAKALVGLKDTKMSNYTLGSLSQPAPQNNKGAPYNPSKAPGKTSSSLSSFKLPKFAEGGIVTGTTLGLIGESAAARPEVVAPLSKLESMLSGVGRGDIHVTVTGNTILDDVGAERLGGLIVRQLQVAGVT